MPIEIKFHITTPYDRLARIDTNCYGHMTKMATMPIHGKNYLNILWNQRPLALGLGMQHCECGPYQVCTNDESRLTLTYFMARSNLIPNAFILGKSLNVHFSINVLAEFIIVKPSETLSFGPPHTNLNIFFSEITGQFDGLFIRLFTSLDQNGYNPHIW